MMHASFDGGMLAGMVIFWLVWLLAVRELVRGVQHGEMVPYGRGGRTNNAIGRTRLTYRNQKVSFCLLFVFYLGISGLVPLATLHVAKQRGGIAKMFEWQPPQPPPENNPVKASSARDTGKRVSAA